MRKRLLVIIFFLAYLGLSTLFAQNKALDSLKKLLPTVRDTARLKLLIDISWKARNIDPLTTIKYAKIAYAFAKDTLKREDLMARTLNYMGVGYRNMGNYKQALETFFEASKLSEKFKIYDVLGYNLQSIGDIYNMKGKYEEAIPYIKQALVAFEEINDQRGISYCYYTFGQIYHNQKKYKEAINNYTNSLIMRKRINDKDGAASVTNRIGITYSAMKEYSKALQFHTEALAVYEQLASKRNIVWVNIGIASVYKYTGQAQEAIALLNQYLPLAKKINANDYLKDMYFELADAYALVNNYAKAYEMEKLFIAYKDSSLVKSTLQEIEYLEIAYDKEKKEREIEEIKNKQEKSSREIGEIKNKQKTDYLIFYSFAIVVTLVLLFALLFVFFLIQGNKRQKQANKLLAEKNEEILSQRNVLEEKKQEIELKNEYINASIKYAQTIQQAILPTDDALQKTFPAHFILYRPKDIVSGDFYWLQSFEDEHVLVAADCTGHGVAGAFMTLIAGTLLDKITHTEHIHSPQEILNRLHQEIQDLLHQEKTGNNNGMDAVVIHLKEMNNLVNITFCGAKNSLYYALPNSQDIHKLAGERKGIGGLQNEKIFFKNQTIGLPKGSMIYFGSDGLEDQNDIGRKRLGERKLASLLSKMAAESIQTQGQILEEFLDKYMQGTRQRDDILWMGIRI